MKKTLIFKILYLFLILIVVTGASVFATKTYLANNISYTKEGSTVKNVEEALNELYKKNSSINDLGYIKDIWNNNSSSINYTYTVQEKGKYLVCISNCNNENNVGTITTNGNIVLNHTEYSTWNTHVNAVINLIEANINDTIMVNAYAQSSVNAFIVKLENINVSEIAVCKARNDENVECTYTANSGVENVLAFSFECGSNRTKNIEYNGKYSSCSSKSNNIHYVSLGSNSNLKIQSYGYGHGGGVICILK